MVMELRLTGSTLLLLLLGGAHLVLAQPPIKYNRFKNGVRLAGDIGPKGRLEVSSSDAWFTRVMGKPSWSPVCESPLFTDDDALIMCQMLNYTYGRKYYSRFTAAPRNETGQLYVGGFYCEARVFPPPPPVRSPPPQAASNASPPRGTASSGRRLLRQGVESRSLFSPLTGTIHAPKSSPYTCRMKPGTCSNTGPFVGIECSYTPMVDAPPPPPSPPRPPPSPPAVSSSIRFYGMQLTERMITYGDLEPNLVDYGNGFGNLYGRIELLVTLNDNTVWAPVCMSESSNDFFGINDYAAYIACEQLYDWPQPFDGGVAIVLPQLAPDFIQIPDGAEGPEDFDPNQVPAWVTVTGSQNPNPLSMQDMDITISTDPCESNQLLTLVCQPFGEGFRRRRN